LCNYFYDGTRISANSDINVFAEEIGRKTTDSAEKNKKTKKSHFIYDATEEQFLKKTDSFLSFSTAVSILKFPFKYLQFDE
jgi:hypothetical protein